MASKEDSALQRLAEARAHKNCKTFPLENVETASGLLP